MEFSPYLINFPRIFPFENKNNHSNITDVFIERWTRQNRNTE